MPTLLLQIALQQKKMKEMNDYKNIYTNFVQIGEGSFGKIYKAKNRSTNAYRAIKIIDKEKIKKLLRNQYMKDDIDNEFKSYYKYFLNEIEYMKICCKDNINSVKLYNYYDTDTELAIVMELCDDSLQSILNKKINGFNKQEIYDIITQLNNTFKIMNKNHIIHRDIKLDNILVKYTDETKTKFIVKLTDYGLSKQLVSLSKFCITHAGTPLTMAPEILNDEEYNSECDLWSLGIIIYQMFFKKYPYISNTEIGLFKQITNFGQNLLEKTKDEKLDYLISKLLIIDPKKRMTCDEYFNFLK